MFDLNVTLFIQLINFVVALILINVVLIRPVRELLHKRRASRYDMIRKAHAFTDQAAADMAEYEKALRAAREEGATMRQTRREEGQAEQARLIASAQAEAAAMLQREKERAGQEAETARRALSAQVQTMADAVADKLLA